MTEKGNRWYSFPPNEPPSSSVDVQAVQTTSFVRNFFGATTLHGFPQFIRQNGWIRKIFWFLCICGSGYALFWEMDIFFSKVTLWKPSTAVSYERHSKLYFPAVTICNNNAAVDLNKNVTPANSGGGTFARMSEWGISTGVTEGNDSNGTASTTPVSDDWSTTSSLEEGSHNETTPSDLYGEDPDGTMPPPEMKKRKKKSTDYLYPSFDFSGNFPNFNFKI